MKTISRIVVAGSLALFLLVFTVNVSNPQISGISQFAFGDRHWRAPVAQISDLPTTGNLPGDTIRVISTWNIYYWNGTGWVLDASSQGLQGEQGIPGVDGIDGTNGTNGSNGANGSNGLDGKTILNGSGSPSNSLGVDGDFYIDVLVWDIYGPKQAGSWGSGTSLIGPQGIQGIQGVQGLTGATGSQGAQGIQGPQGIQGVAGTTGATGSTGPAGPQGPTGATGSSGIISATAPLIYNSGTQSLSLSITTTDPAGAVVLQSSSPGTSQTGHSNISGTSIAMGGFRSGTTSDDFYLKDLGFAIVSCRNGADSGYCIFDAERVRTYAGGQVGVLMEGNIGVGISSSNFIRFVNGSDATQTPDVRLYRDSSGNLIIDGGTSSLVGGIRLNPGAVGPCGSGQKGLGRVAADGSWCTCNGSVWTAQPITGSCV